MLYFKLCAYYLYINEYWTHFMSNHCQAFENKRQNTQKQFSMFALNEFAGSLIYENRLAISI